MDHEARWRGNDDDEAVGGSRPQSLGDLAARRGIWVVGARSVETSRESVGPI